MFRHLFKYCEGIDGQLSYRFAKHSRFIFWLYNLHYCNRIVSQGKLFLQENTDVAIAEIKELKEFM